MSFARKHLRPRQLSGYAFLALVFWLARPTPASILAGLPVILAGSALRFWATGHLIKNDELAVSGPYAFVRHPLYLGSLLIGLGFAVTANSLPVGICVALFLAWFFGHYLPNKERIESARLEARFGEAYHRYATAVPALLPRLYPYQPLGAEGVAVRWQGVRFAENHETGVALAILACLGLMVVRWQIS